jgi:DNA replication protein DnaC
VRKGFDGESQGLFVRALSAPLLALDDLGSEAVTDWVRDRIYTLLNHRWDHCLPLLVTTNVAPADLAERIGQGVASRIAGCCARRITVKGPDARREAGER